MLLAYILLLLHVYSAVEENPFLLKLEELNITEVIIVYTVIV